MPQVNYCPHCKKAFMYSSYQMIKHYKKFHQDKFKIIKVIDL